MVQRSVNNHVYVLLHANNHIHIVMRPVVYNHVYIIMRSADNHIDIVTLPAGKLISCGLQISYS